MEPAIAQWNAFDLPLENSINRLLSRAKADNRLRAPRRKTTTTTLKTTTTWTTTSTTLAEPLDLTVYTYPTKTQDQSSLTETKIDNPPSTTEGRKEGQEDQPSQVKRRKEETPDPIDWEALRKKIVAGDKEANATARALFVPRSTGPDRRSPSPDNRALDEDEDSDAYDSIGCTRAIARAFICAHTPKRDRRRIAEAIDSEACQDHTTEQFSTLKRKAGRSTV